MKPICVPCQRFYRMKKSGFYFIEAMPVNGNPEPGASQPNNWEPYKVWSGDLWKCEGCGHEIVHGTGIHPIAEHYQKNFQEVVDRLNANQFQVNDC